MAAFLAAIEELSPQEAEAATGISWMSVTNYRKGEWVRLTARVQRQMRAFLERRPKEAGPGWAEGYRAAVEDMQAVLEKMREREEVREGAAGALRVLADASDPAGSGGRPKEAGTDE